MQSTDGITGWLEVTVNGTLVHSKKNGDGYINTPAKMQKIMDAIRAGLRGQTAAAPAKTA
jgi:predicted Rdx family selenoprotein